MRGLAAALALGATLASAQPVPVTPVADPRVAAPLESARLHYVVDEDGDFRILYERPGGRTQVVWIASATSSAGSLELRRDARVRDGCHGNGLRGRQGRAEGERGDEAAHR